MLIVPKIVQSLIQTVHLNPWTTLQIDARDRVYKKGHFEKWRRFWKSYSYSITHGTAEMV